jgi:predicted TIM-barrel enzyme
MPWALWAHPRWSASRWKLLLRRPLVHSSRFQLDVPGRSSAAGKSAGATIGRFRLARTLAQTENANVNTTWILCPWLKRRPQESDIWTSVLATHDINGVLLASLPISKRIRDDVYAGIFAVDILRTTAEIIHRLKNAGVGGVINFPSVSFIDGGAGAILGSLSLGIGREMECLEACVREGLRAGGVVGSIEAAQTLLGMGVDFLVAHGGPPTRNNKDPGAAAVSAISDIARPKKVPVIPISELVIAACNQQRL